MNDILVSVSVISYNSEKTILETLESIKSQTYQNIELIVSDDCSQDKTVEITEQWIAENKERFARVELLTIDHNSGISANVNRALRACQGEWMKGIAADDILLPECISTNINYVLEHKYVEIVYSRLSAFKKEEDGSFKFLYNTPLDKDVNDALLFSENTAHEQFIKLLNYGCIVQAPSCFAKVDLLRKNLCDEKYKLIDDYPQMLQITRSGTKLFFFPDITVLYRIGNSVSRGEKINRNFIFDKHKLFWAENINYIKAENLDYAYKRNRKDLLCSDLIEAFTSGNKILKNKIVSFLVYFIVEKFAKFSL